MPQVKTKAMRDVEEKDPQGRDIQQILIDAINEHKTKVAAAKALDVSLATIDNWLWRTGIRLEVETTFKVVEREIPEEVAENVG